MNFYRDREQEGILVLRHLLLNNWMLQSRNQAQTLAHRMELVIEIDFWTTTTVSKSPKSAGKTEKQRDLLLPWPMPKFKRLFQRLDSNLPTSFEMTAFCPKWTSVAPHPDTGHRLLLAQISVENPQSHYQQHTCLIRTWLDLQRTLCVR